LLSGCRYTVEFLADYSCRDGSDAVELLKLASDGPKLIDCLDVLSIEHVPGKLRYIKTLNGSFAGLKMMRHLPRLWCRIRMWAALPPDVGLR
jgi:hypothetical protein